eukprot:gene43951-54614_t
MSFATCVAWRVLQKKSNGDMAASNATQETSEQSITIKGQNRVEEVGEEDHR